jgi:hypothetical protein
MLKLAKLPDPKTTKVVFTASSKLHQELHSYAALYRSSYGETATVAELIPFMLDAFLKSDPAFVKAQRDGTLDQGAKQPSRSPRAGKGTPASIETPSPSTED